MDTRKYEALLTAADLGSMSAAADKLGYTQSGITRMISSLEDDIGFPLLHRSRHGVSLTDNGAMMAATMRDILRLQKNMEETAADISGVVKGTLTIGSYYSVASMWLPEILSAYEALYPGIDIRLLEGGNLDMKKWLNEKSVDCAFCAQPSQDTMCDWMALIDDPLVAWLPPGHPKAGAKRFNIKDLENHPFIRTLPDHDTEQDRLIHDEHLHLDVRYTTRDSFSTYNMVAEGLGISFNQSLIARKWHPDVAIVPLSPKRYVTMGLAVPALPEASPATRRLVDITRKVMTDMNQA